jgi:hypothetical protein
LNYQFAPGRRAALESLAEESLSEARAIESADAPPFEEFLASHLSLGIMDSPQAGTEICD